MAAKKKDPTKEYIVIKPNTLDHSVGDKIDLTDRQAKNLVGKVRLASEVAGANEAKATSADLKKLKALEEENAKLKEQNGQLQEANTEFADRNVELEEENAELKEKLEAAEKAE